MMPLGPQLMRDLNIGPQYFSTLVAAYTVSSGVIGLFTAPFIDRFDRRKLLLFAYAGFLAGTLICALSSNAATLLVARMLSGAFGGLSISMVMSIIGDVVPPQRRAAGIGIVMTAFSAASALGVPIGLQLAQWFRWEAPFFMLTGIGCVIWLTAFFGLPPVRGHIDSHGADPRRAFIDLLRDANAGPAILFMSVTVVGHFAIIPLLSPFFVGNVGLPERDLFLVYLTGGVLTVFTAPRIGRLADSFGRLRVFTGLVAIASIVILFISNSGQLPVWGVLALSGAFFVFASGRFVPAQAIMTLAVPASRRGAFMSLSGCARDLSMGLTSSLAGWIVTRDPSGHLNNYDKLGWLAVGAGLLSVWLGSRVRVKDVSRSPQVLQTEAQPALEV
jgi:MFS transporter, DHA1 family, inner membrane transport protein